MKKLLLILTVLVGAAFTTSCEGPSGPQGPPGPTEYPYVSEISINFNENSNHTDYSYKHPVRYYKGDNILVFILDGSLNNGKDPIWRPLPASYDVTKNGQTNTINYFNTFDPYQTTIFVNTKDNVNLGWFSDSPVGSFTRDMVFRIMYLPGSDPVSAFSVKDTTANTPLSYEEAVEKYNLQNIEVVRN